MFNIDDILRGYSGEQYSKAIVETLTQFLISKNIITSDEVKEYFKDNFNNILNLIVERDREEVKRETEEYKSKISKEGNNNEC